MNEGNRPGVSALYREATPASTPAALASAGPPTWIKSGVAMGPMMRRTMSRSSFRVASDSDADALRVTYA